MRIRCGRRRQYQPRQPTVSPPAPTGRPGCGTPSVARSCNVPHDGGVRTASFSPDGRTVVTACADKTARVWDVGYLSIPDDVDPDRLRAWVLVRTGQVFTEEGKLRPLTKEEWLQQRRTLDAKGGDWQPPPDPRKWHLVQAADAEAHEAWFAARFHLNQLLEGRSEQSRSPPSPRRGGDARKLRDAGNPPWKAWSAVTAPSGDQGLSSEDRGACGIRRGTRPAQRRAASVWRLDAACSRYRMPTAKRVNTSTRV